ncbi:unnamed protein product, partial [Prorocentrum cordatum]
MAPKKAMKKAKGKAAGTKGTSALRRPAAAANSSSKQEWQLAVRDLPKQGAVVKAKFDADEDEGQRIDGEADSRQTSLSQRHVFKMCRESICKEDLDKYDWYKSKECTIKGKERLANEIINAYVPRDVGYGGRIKPDKMALQR